MRDEENGPKRPPRELTEPTASEEISPEVNLVDHGLLHSVLASLQARPLDSESQASKAEEARSYLSNMFKAMTGLAERDPERTLPRDENSSPESIEGDE